MIRTPLLSPTKDTVAQNNDNGDNNKPWTLARWDAHVQYHQQERRRRPSFSKPITAYLEPDWNVTERIVPTSSSSSDNLSRNIYYEPLPLRNQSPKDLKRWVYPHAAHTCRDIPSKLPIDKGPPPLWNNNDTTKQSILWNTLASPIPLQKLLQTELPHCPVDGDPYLPWIHDVFVSNNDSIQIIAQNKRRCNTGSDYSADLERLEPQVALFQPVSVQRITQIQAEQLAPTLWKEEDPNHSTAMRYRLTSIPQADAPFTRFVCQFHTWSHDHARIELGETFSEYNFNYEYVDFLKNKQNHPGLLSKQGKDNGRFWASTLMFSCPLPTFLKGSTNIAAYDDDNYLRMPLLHLDIIPIRVPPRFPLSLDDPGYYFKQDMVGPEYVGSFDPLKAWGTHHVLPHIKASGRWTNLPICPVPQQQQQDNDAKLTRQSPPTKKKHFLSACLWASASYETRGVNRAMTDTKARLLEWIEFHLLVGFDHIYIYDNSGAHHNANINDTLQDIVDRFGSKKVTRIDWPSVVCNNNIPAHDNTGERSSQYAAEHSCLLRFGSQTEWMATFDTDEYLVPLGNFTSFQQVLDPTQNPRMQDTRILSFRSTRGKLKFTASE